MKREEARLIAEAEAKEKALEDAEEARLEKLRVEQEKRDKKKQKDKVIEAPPHIRHRPQLTHTDRSELVDFGRRGRKMSGMSGQVGTGRGFLIWAKKFFSLPISLYHTL